MAEQWSSYIRRHLDERDWTPTDLSKAAGINRSIIGRWLHEGAQPEVRTARALARALGRPVIEVLVSSGLLEPDEVGVTDVRVLTVGELSDEELVDEIGQRLAQRGRERPPVRLQDVTVEVDPPDESPVPQEPAMRHRSSCGDRDRA